jgi:outer membrane lipoprotein-sorting protein
VDGDSLSYALTSEPSNGSISFNGDGTFSYTPNLNFNGADSFIYTVDDGNGGSDTATVTITVNAINDDPVAGDDSFTTDEDTLLAGDVSGNDSDVDGDSLSYALTSEPSNGSISFNGDGTFSYTPNLNFNGADSFIYTVDDGNGGSDTATVTITVNAINDDPVAGDDSFTTEVGRILTGNLLLNDTDLDGDLLQVVQQPVVKPTNGSVILQPNGEFEYRPERGYFGTDSFVYEVVDGAGGSSLATVTIDVSLSYAYDFFRNEATMPNVAAVQPSVSSPDVPRTQPLAAVDPIFTGFAEPGTTLVGKIYDSSGNLIGERTANADSAGNWLMSFSNSVIHTHPHRMTVEQTSAASSQTTMGGGFNLRRYYHTASYPTLFFSKQFSVQSVLAGTPYHTLNSLTDANEEPLGLDWAAHPYELLAASSSAAEM